MDSLDLSQGAMIWVIVAFILAIVGGIFAYFLFVRKQNTYKGFLAWLHDFMDFKTLYIEDAVKVLYTITAIFITLFSFALISTNFLSFLMTLIVGNVAARLGYEAAILTILLVKNTSAIKKQLCDKDDKKVEKKK